MKDDQIYLLHIRDAISKIQAYTKDGRPGFFRESMMQDAVVRNIEVIGEAVKHLSDTFKAAHPDIPWKRIAGMRDIMIHEYFGVDLKLVWDAVEKDVPVLKQAIEKILLRMTKARSPKNRKIAPTGFEPVFEP